MNQEYLTINQLSDYLPDKLKIGTIYNLVHQKKIPFTKFGKKLLFIKSEIDNWNEAGRPETITR